MVPFKKLQLALALFFVLMSIKSEGFNLLIHSLFAAVSFYLGLPNAQTEPDENNQNANEQETESDKEKQSDQ